MVVVRKPLYADNRWYPSTESGLRTDLNQYFSMADPQELAGEVLGLIAPHAGYFFSGHVAAAAYKQVYGKKYQRVILIGPDHRGSTMGRLATTTADAWATPLGETPIDTEWLAAIADACSLVKIKNDSEHSLEVQLPFLQMALGDFSLAPIIMGDHSPHVCQRLGEAIADSLAGQPGTLLVASSDLSHYHPHDQAQILDKNTLSYVLDFRPREFAEALILGQANACGGAPIATVMFALSRIPGIKATLIKYATSGDVWQDKSSVVGYAAVAFVKP
jgi:MEMO1 family protein